MLRAFNKLSRKVQQIAVLFKTVRPLQSKILNPPPLNPPPLNPPNLKPPILKPILKPFPNENEYKHHGVYTW